MISAAIQSTLLGIIPNTFFAIGDEKIITPFCVHKESGTPINLKSGLVGYTYQCEVVIIDDLPEKVETLVMSVKAALEALAGTTVSTTIIDAVTFEGDDPDFDTEDKMYINILRFTFETSNR